MYHPPKTIIVQTKVERNSTEKEECKCCVNQQVINAPQLVFNNPTAKQNLVTLFSNIISGQQQEQRSMFRDQMAAFFTLADRQAPGPNMPPNQ